MIEKATRERSQPFETEMVLIPASEFLMGSDPRRDKYIGDDERPQHILYLPSYYLAKTPVTNAQYAAFVQATGHAPPKHWEGGKQPSGKEDHPVLDVCWYDAAAYCDWLAEITGKPYRLPSEAEWEKGARGNDGRFWPWGNKWDAGRCNSAEGGLDDTAPVGAYPAGASPYGLLDMAGNVWEWTCSVYKDYPYSPEDGREILGAEDFRVLRGGAFIHDSGRVRCASRNWHLPFTRWLSGFRVMMSPVTPLAGSESIGLR
jgi:formylglycine-generating enzyme required for sulfatase activity